VSDIVLSAIALSVDGKGDSRLTASHPRTHGQDVDTLQQQFGALIRRRRHEAGLGQEALADKATLHRTHVSLLERGKRMPTLIVVKKLAAALETTMASLMEELEMGETGGESKASPKKGK
jgi:ribosome-binding protein aMBF1 (putative translation factor)